MTLQMLELGGKEYVVLERAEYDRLALRRNPKAPSRSSKMPEIPKSDANGLRPARETLRAILARDIIKDRLAVGWSQQELARRSGIRPETLCRIEAGATTPTVITAEKIDAALRSAAAGKLRL